MDRRNTIKTLMAASTGLVALPAWADSWDLRAVTVHSGTFSASQQDLLASVADTIIPEGNGIGAHSVGVDKFLQKLFDQCYEEDIRQNIKVQLEALDASAQKVHGQSFTKCDQQQRETLLLALSKSEDEPERDFFELVKSETIRGFSTSQEVMVNYLNYKVVPGRYSGCVNVNT